MTFGLGSYALAWAIGVPGYPPERPLDPFAFVAYAAEVGFGRVQIADNLPLHTLSEGELERLRTLTQRLGIAVEVGTRGLTEGHLERYLELARSFQSPILRVVVDSAGHHPEPDEVAHILQGIVPQFERAGVTLAIENHDRFKARDLVNILERVGSPSVGICLDTVNSFGALEGPEVVVNTLGPFVVNLHIKDFTVQRAAHSMGFSVTGTPAGRGMLDLPRLVEELSKGGRNPSGILELWPAPEASLGETVAKEKRWVEESYAYLTGISSESKEKP